MAECDPPKPPPLLREPERRSAIAAEQRATEQARRQDQEDLQWTRSVAFQLLDAGCGCLILIVATVTAATAWGGALGDLFPAILTFATVLRAP